MSATAPTTPVSRYAPMVVINLVAALVFILLVSLLPEPARRYAMVALLAVAAVVYLQRGHGRTDRLFAAGVGLCSAGGLFSYTAIGLSGG